MPASREAPRFREACAADDVLAKPFNIIDIYAVVERHLQGSPSLASCALVPAATICRDEHKKAARHLANHTRADLS